MKCTEDQSTRGAAVNIQADNIKCAEYNPSTDENGALCSYIAVETGQPLQIACSFHGNCTEGIYDIIVDGVLRFTRAFKSRQTKHTSKKPPELFEYVLVKDGKGVRCGSLEVQDLASPASTQSTFESAGTIEVRISVLREPTGKHANDDVNTFDEIDGWKEMWHNATHAAVPVTHEIAFPATKDDALSKTAVTNCRRAAKKPRPGSKPWAVFKFLYRSREAIESAGFETTEERSFVLDLPPVLSPSDETSETGTPGPADPKHALPSQLFTPGAQSPTSKSVSSVKTDKSYGGFAPELPSTPKKSKKQQQQQLQTPITEKKSKKSKKPSDITIPEIEKSDNMATLTAQPNSGSLFESGPEVKDYAENLPTPHPTPQQIKPASEAVSSTEADVPVKSINPEATEPAKTVEIPATEITATETNIEAEAPNGTKRSADYAEEVETNGPPLKKPKTNGVEEHETTSSISNTEGFSEPVVEPVVEPAVERTVEPTADSFVKPVESTPVPPVKPTEAVTPSSTRSLTPSLATNPILAEKMRLLEERRARATAVKKRAKAAEEKHKAAVAKAGEKHRAKLEEIEREMMELDEVEREAEEAERRALEEVEMLEMEE
ncbi:hypothetical protein LTS18_003465 [Coniosporium uncinatum]|uniref:Uncharacterized protein n=1 Tax=Coniosporium uncinatum TaxID=93489 RepID=A0ACC3DTE7_9PEZI|nr:hypothetical protein LTS18_003465 [Coniosporium uncinatum]